MAARVELSEPSRSGRRQPIQSARDFMDFAVPPSGSIGLLQPQIDEPVDFLERLEGGHLFRPDQAAICRLSFDCFRFGALYMRAAARVSMERFDRLSDVLVSE